MRDGAIISTDSPCFVVVFGYVGGLESETLVGDLSTLISSAPGLLNL